MSRSTPVLQKRIPAFSGIPLQRNITQYDEHKRGGTNERQTDIHIAATECCDFTAVKFASFYSSKLAVSELNHHEGFALKSMNVIDVL